MQEKTIKLLNWSRGKKQGPYSIEIHPTNLCNCNCIMCGTRVVHRQIKKERPEFNPDEEKNYRLTDKELLNLISEGHKLGVREWLITGGGEPMIRKEVTLPMMKKIKELGMEGNINTNGALWTEKDIEMVVRAGWDKIMFSIDGGDSETHDFIRGVPGTFDKAKNTLNLIQKWKQKLKTDNPKVIFNTVICKSNYKKFDKLIKLAQNIGCEDITFIPLVTYEDFRHDIKMSEQNRKEFQKLIPKYKKIMDKSRIGSNIEYLQEKKIEKSTDMHEVILSENKKESTNEANDFSSVPCFEPFTNLVIKMDGVASPCCMLNDLSINVKKQSLEKLWFGPYFANLRKSMIKKELPPQCSTCLFTQVAKNQELRQEIRKGLENNE